MKKLTITLTALSLAAISLLGVVSCQKEKTEEKPIVQQDPEAQRALERISEFKNKVKDHRNNSLARSSETIRLEDALWNIENVFNATYSQPEIRCSETSEFTFSLYLAIDSNGNVFLNDLFDLYDQVVIEARNAYSNDGFTNKAFLYMTIESDGISDNKVRLVFRGRSGERTDIPWHPYQDTCLYKGPFGIDDNYHYDYGKCDGTGVDGADEMLTCHVGNYIASHLTTPHVGMRAVYINTIDIILYGCVYTNDLFFRTNIHSTCIDFNNMNRLYNTEKALVTETLPCDPQSDVYGMTPIGIFVYPEHRANYDFIAHNNRVTYSWRVIADLNVIGEVEDLLIDQNIN